MATRYLRGDVVDQILARIDKSGSTLTPYWELTDHLGSVRDVIDNSGAVVDSLKYDSFGNIDVGTELDAAYRGRYTWTGREFDVETQLQFNRARYYDSTTGRWISQDPLGFDAGDSNLYRYVNNRPTGVTDPSGLFGDSPNFGLLQVKDVIADGIKEAKGNVQDYEKAIQWEIGDFKDSTDQIVHSSFWNPAEKGKTFVKRIQKSDVEFGQYFYMFGNQLKWPGYTGTVVQKTQVKYDWYEGKNKVDTTYSTVVESFSIKNGVCEVVDRHSHVENIPISVDKKPLPWTVIRSYGSIEVGPGTYNGKDLPAGEPHKLYVQKEYAPAPDWGKGKIAFTGKTIKLEWNVSFRPDGRMGTSGPVQIK